MKLVTRPPLERFQHIAAALKSRKRTSVVLLADELAVCPKTVERDIEFMRDRLGHPIEKDSAGYWFAFEIKLCRCCARRVRI